MTNILKKMHSPRSFVSPPTVLPGMNLEPHALEGGRDRVSQGLSNIYNSTIRSSKYDDSPVKIPLKFD